MYEQLTERVGVLTGGVNVGVIRTESGSVILVDTGANAGNARKMLRIIRDELDADVEGILSTHGHADHFGGHAFVVKRTDAAVYAPRFEATILEHPELQPIFLYGGAAPPRALQERFILAEACLVDAMVDPGPLDVAGTEIEVIALPGHSPNQVGYLVDGVFFCADVVFPATAIEKYRIPYLFDLGAHQRSMGEARRVTASHVVAGHGPVEPNIGRLVDLNQAIVAETIEAVHAAVDRPRTLEEICDRVFQQMAVPITGHISYYLLRPTIGAYLTWMEAEGLVAHGVEGKAAVWQRAT